MMNSAIKQIFYILIGVLTLACGSDDDGNENPQVQVQISYARLGSQSIVANSSVTNASQFYIGFNQAVNANSSWFSLTHEGHSVAISVLQGQTNQEIILQPHTQLLEGESYTLSVSSNLVSQQNSQFEGTSYQFSIQISPLLIHKILSSGAELTVLQTNKNISLTPTFEVEFSHPILAEAAVQHIHLSPQVNLSAQQVNENTISISPTQALDYWKSYSLQFSQSLSTVSVHPFQEKNYSLFTTLDTTDKFEQISDEQLLDLIQSQTFKYFWEFAHPVSGMAKERNTSENTVTTGGTGFGLQAMVVALHRNFITRSEAIQRWQTIVNFLEQADRFHGAWPHWMNGTTGATIPFSQYDDGADLVETAFLIQGLLTVRAELSTNDATELALINKINKLWEEVEWSWFQKNNEEVLYWHWSPNYNWQINMKISGHNETQIVYVLAASSPTYPITKSVYENGYARSGAMVNGNSFYNIELPLGNSNYGGPLFFTHYSYLGLDPRNLEDQYANYWTQNTNHSRINYEYCVDNPKQFIGYSNQCWGLTASDGDTGYSAHSPTNDKGVISPTAAISSLPYTPSQSMEAIRFFYYKIGDRLWGDYGFYDAFNPSNEWTASSYLAIDQGPIICMIENYRTGLLWNLFMSNQEISSGLDSLGFTY